MESLLTLSIGEYRLVELALRLLVALIGSASLLMLLGITCTAQHYRLPLIISGVALLAAAWFESSVWLAWKEAFELAGTSYCVTGHLLGSEDRILTWSFGVPTLLFSLGLLQAPGGNADRRFLKNLLIAALALAITAPFSSTLALALLLYIAWMLCVHLPKQARKQTRNHHCVTSTRLSVGSIALGLLLLVLGGFHLWPASGEAGSVLVRGEILRSLIDLLSLVVPAAILLIAAFTVTDQELPAGREGVSPEAPKEIRTRTRRVASDDPQTGLFGS